MLLFAGVDETGFLTGVANLLGGAGDCVDNTGLVECIG